MLNSGREILPYTEFIAASSDIPEPFRDLVEYVGEAFPPKPVVKAKPQEYKLSKASAGWWNVLHISTKKHVNSKLLRKEQANALLNELTK